MSLALTTVVAYSADVPPRRDAPPPPPIRDDPPPLRNPPPVDEFPQDLPIREALLKIWDAQIRYWNLNNRMHYGRALKSLRDADDADDEKRRLPIELAAADANDASPKSYRGYFFKLVVVGDKPADYAVIAYPAVYEQGKTRAILLDSGGTLYARDLGNDPATALMSIQHRDKTWTKLSDPRRTIYNHDWDRLNIDD